MELFLILFIVYGIPSIVGLFLLRWILREFNVMKLGNILLLVFVPCFLIVISWISYADWRERQHFLTVSLANNCHLMIEMEEINSFLDYPVEFNLALLNPKGTIEKTYEFSLGRGPYAIIRVSLEDPQTLEIVGYYTNRNHVDRFELPRDLHLQLGDTIVKIDWKFEAAALNRQKVH